MNRPAREQLGVSVWLRLMKAHGLMLRAARRSVEPRLTLPQFDVLAHLARSHEGMTSVELSRHLLVSPGNLTGIVDRLERDRLVCRAAHESDGRATRIQLTRAGRRRLSALLPRHTRDIESFLAGVPRRDLRRLRALLGRLTHSLEQP